MLRFGSFIGQSIKNYMKRRWRPRNRLNLGDSGSLLHLLPLKLHPVSLRLLEWNLELGIEQQPARLMHLEEV